MAVSVKQELEASRDELLCLAFRQTQTHSLHPRFQTLRAAEVDAVLILH